MGAKLALRGAAIHGADRIRLYWLAALYGTLADGWTVDVRECSRGHAESVVPGVFRDRRAGLFVSSRRGHLEFSMQVGTGGYGQSAAGGGAAWGAGGIGVQRGRDSDYY